MLNISEIFAEISQFLADGETPPPIPPNPLGKPLNNKKFFS